MKQYAVIQHTYSEFLGLIEAQLEKRDIGFLYFRPFVGQALPADPLMFDALFLLGGRHLTGDAARSPWGPQERELIGRFLSAGRPVVGLGFGGMLVAEHAGATPRAEPFHNAYWAKARATAAGKGDPLAEAVDGRGVLVWCNGSAHLPPGVEPIIEDEQGNWIAVRPHPLAYGMLFRPELKPGMIEDCIMEAGREVPEDIDGLLREARAQWEQTQRTTDRVIAALVGALDLMQERRKPPVIPIKAI